jgi:hypothetical protein
MKRKHVIWMIIGCSVADHASCHEQTRKTRGGSARFVSVHQWCNCEQFRSHWITEDEVLLDRLARVFMRNFPMENFVLKIDFKA